MSKLNDLTKKTEQATDAAGKLTRAAALLEECFNELKKRGEAEDLIDALGDFLDDPDGATPGKVRKGDRVFVATGRNGEGFVAEADPDRFQQWLERGREIWSKSFVTTDRSPSPCLKPI